MLRTYPEDTIRRKSAQAFYVVWLGLVVMVVCAVYGEANKDVFLFMDGVGALLISALIMLGNILYIIRTFRKKELPAVEIVDGKVVAFHAKPFVYKVDDLGETSLVDLDMEMMHLHRSISFPVGDKVAKVTIGVAVTPNRQELQKYFDLFLDPDRAQTKPPRMIADEVICAFLRAVDKNDLSYDAHDVKGELNRWGLDTQVIVCSTEVGTSIID